MKKLSIRNKITNSRESVKKLRLNRNLFPLKDKQVGWWLKGMEEWREEFGMFKSMFIWGLALWSSAVNCCMSHQHPIWPSPQLPPAPLSIQLAAHVLGTVSEAGPSTWISATQRGNPDSTRLLAAGWPSSDHCGLLGSEPVYPWI